VEEYGSDVDDSLGQCKQGVVDYGRCERYVPIFDVDDDLGRLLGGFRIVPYIPYCLDIVDLYLSQARYHVMVHVMSQS